MNLTLDKQIELGKLFDNFRELKKFASHEFDKWEEKDIDFKTFSSHLNIEKSKKDKEIAVELVITDTITLYVTRVLLVKLLLKYGYINNNYKPKYFLSPNDLIKKQNSNTPSLYKNIREQIIDINQLPYSAFERYLFDRDKFTCEVERAIQELHDLSVEKIDQKVLGDIYQKLLNISKRKYFGEFYTPNSIVEYIIKETILKNDNKINGKVLDPSCGFGTFLIEAKRALKGENSSFPYSNLVGFDVNDFAVTLTKFQLLWDMIKNREKQNKNIDELNIFYLDSLEKETSEKEFDLFSYDEVQSDIKYQFRDKTKYQYIIGNPPYIRAERLKNGKNLKREWEDVWGANADTALIFLYRSLTEWIMKDGMVGLVVSGGYANSGAAKPIRELLSKKVTLKKVIWLEFVNKVWDASAIPMILIIENKIPKDNDIIKIACPQKWPEKNIEFQSFTYKEFFNEETNPEKHLLPLLVKGDLDILLKLSEFKKLGSLIKFKYGIQRGKGAKLLAQQKDERTINVIDGKSMYVGGTRETVGWIELDNVQKRSLWNENFPLHGYIALPGITLAPTAVFIDNPNVAALDTSIVGTIPDSRKMRAVASYLNSNIVRFITLVQLRSGVMEGSHRLHVYPRTVESLPINFDERSIEALEKLYSDLAASSAKQDKESFGKTISKIDQVVARMFGINSRQLGYITDRLAQYPLNKLLPRYSWNRVKSGTPKGYEKDRYSFKEN
ncbi:HsdM family class I SAM-dependent methyltransferase [Priestia aryabhattai]|uniref:HsdM family class I SAM-dependent methyltransferase n=1 Tax=Priestia aryabhattai TaxID=412384 RepID=UPI00159BB549|nr:N-6 DNA methylase [Priestia aryabhattai]